MILTPAVVVCRRIAVQHWSMALDITKARNDDAPIPEIIGWDSELARSEFLRSSASATVLFVESTYSIC
ncbi:hypothetical protein [Nocardia sp. CA-135398]|uniref:hypothetical protein n=1 Tax=Nocardia sp. CA-135398 TaxID=3239977 RepID=UPI003D981A9E